MENKNWDHVFLGFNRTAFIRDIFEKDFNANVRACAMALDMTPNYLRELIYIPTRGAGNKTLSNIYRYCKKTDKDPDLYIFVER